MGISFAGIKVADKVPTVMAIAMPLAAILGALYVAEDRLIGHIIAYKSALAKRVAGEANDAPRLYNLESSPEARSYTKTVLPVRLIAQLIAFLVIPLGTTCYRFSSFQNWDWIVWFEMAIHAVCAAAVTWLLLRTFFNRYSPNAG